jgi:ATP-dependent DNA helicase RecG
LNIKDLIGETTEYDKKLELETKKPKSWCKSISAFANCFGGKLIYGVANDGTLVGLEDAEFVSEKISEIIKDRLNPIPEFKLSFKTDKGMKFVIVDVYPGRQTPYYYSADGQLTAFVRVGNESVPATPTQLRELVLKGSGTTYDSLISKYRFEDMAFTKIRSVYKSRTGNAFEDTDYESFGIVDENGNLTNAGALLADESPVRHSRLFCTRWNGLTKASGLVDALDDKEYTGGLVELLQDGIGFIMRNSKKAWKKLPDRRVELPEYPERAVTEGLVNALIHRSYTELGSEVHIDMFDDRLEIYSPGGMVDGTILDNKDVTPVPSKRRNPVLADIFNRLNYMERRGSGFKKIMDDYKFQENYTEKLKPEFYAKYDSFILTLYNLNYLEGQDDIQDDTQDDTQGDTQGDTQDNAQMNIDIKIRELMKDNNKISTKEIAEILGISIITVKRKIKKMPNVVFVGSGYSGHWEVTENE